jgi:type 1 glutamine amidotransferase
VCPLCEGRVWPMYLTGHEPATKSHAEVRATQHRDGLRWSAQFNLRRGLPPKQVEEEFTGHTAESNRR